MNSKIVFRFHAVRRMFERNVSEMEVIAVLTTGKVIENYPDDLPYPSQLKLGYLEGRALHVVVAENKDEQSLIVITVYEPDLGNWEPGFERRKKI